jgi:hypothetical protein
LRDVTLQRRLEAIFLRRFTTGDLRNEERLSLFRALLQVRLALHTSTRTLKTTLAATCVLAAKLRLAANRNDAPLLPVLFDTRATLRLDGKGEITSPRYSI